MISTPTAAQRMPAAGWLRDAASSAPLPSGTDTGVLRIEHVGTENLELDCLIVYGGAADETLTDPLSAAAQQREPYPALELDGGRRGSHITETRVACVGGDQLAATAQTPGT